MICSHTGFAAGTCAALSAGKHLVLCTAGGGVSVLHVESVSGCDALSGAEGRAQRHPQQRPPASGHA